MSLYVLDTDHLTLYRRGHPGVCRRVHACRPAQVAITVITVEEQISGWYDLVRKARKTADLPRIYACLAETVQFLSRVQVLTFSEAAANRYDALHGLKLKVGKMDLRIAAIVLAERGILVTRNRSDFGRIPGLDLEDWST